MNKVHIDMEFTDEQYNTIKWAMQIINETADKVSIEWNPNFKSVKGYGWKEER